MILSDDPRTVLSKALGHMCVPFSTEEEFNEGADSILLILLQAFKAYIKEKQLKDTRALHLLGELWLALDLFDREGGNSFKKISERLTSSLELVEKFENKDTLSEEKQNIKVELKSRGLL